MMPLAPDLIPALEAAAGLGVFVGIALWLSLFGGSN
jgi:hypothetical protein